MVKEGGKSGKVHFREWTRRGVGRVGEKEDSDTEIVLHDKT